MNYSTNIPYLSIPPVSWPAGTGILAEPQTVYDKRPAEKKVYRRDDLLYKAVLEDLFDDFLRFVMPDADQHFDLNRGVEFLNQELEQMFPPEG